MNTIKDLQGVRDILYTANHTYLGGEYVVCMKPDLYKETIAALDRIIEEMQLSADNQAALEAFERIVSDAAYGIGSGDYEIMNKGGYDKDMANHKKDAGLVRATLMQPAEQPSVNAELLEALKGYHRAAQNQGWVDNYPNEFRNAEQAIARAEAQKGE